jgi:hypothetical protein
MPTGWVPDPAWTYQGKPIVMHVSKDYVEPETATTTVPARPVATVEVPSWLDELQAILVENGGW